jgi:acyl-CoA thioesterase-1
VPQASPTVPAPAPASSGDRTFTAIGDSITAGMVQGTDHFDTPGPTSWLSGETAAHLVRMGGWAEPGTVTADMRANVVPTAANLLVLLGGTNDLARGIPWDTTAANLQQIGSTVGARDTLLVAIPPSDADPANRNAFNGRLATLAGQLGWHFLDPWTSVDTGGAWSPGTTVDGIHPTPSAAAAIGRIITAGAWQAAAERTGR